MHSLLKALLSKVPTENWPYPPRFHGGVDANPQLGSFGCGGIAIFLADSCADRVAANQRANFDRWLDAAKNIYSLHARAEGEEVKQGTKSKLRVLARDDLKKLQRDLAAHNPKREARVAFRALEAAIDIELQYGGPDILAILKKTAEEVAESTPAADQKAFIMNFDRILLREELRSLLAQRRDPRCEKIAACVWRFAHATEKARQGRASGAKITHYIGRLDDDKTFLLLWKVGARWQIITGERDEIIASVPDDQMESAIAALLPPS
jgi:hypothetical protein